MIFLLILLRLEIKMTTFQTFEEKIDYLSKNTSSKFLENRKHKIKL